MNSLCTLYIGGRRFGTITSLPTQKDSNSTQSIYFLSDQGNGQRIDLQSIDNEVSDEPLRNLSSTDYIVTTNEKIIYKDKKYRCFGALPTVCQFKAIPISKHEVIDYKSKHNVDDILLSEGYAQELKDAQFILVPRSLMFSRTFTPHDTLIKRKDGDQFIFYSGRVPDNLEIEKTDGRYIYIKNIPIFAGEIIDTPFTYSIDTLTNKYGILQERLHKYGTQKVQSIHAAMHALSDKIAKVSDQFKASSIYDDVVHILEKVRDM